MDVAQCSCFLMFLINIEHNMRGGCLVCDHCDFFSGGEFVGYALHSVKPPRNLALEVLNLRSPDF